MAEMKNSIVMMKDNVTEIIQKLEYENMGNKRMIRKEDSPRGTIFKTQKF